MDKKIQAAAPAHRGILRCGVAAAALMAAPAAHAQDWLASEWTFSGNLTYSDNFRRLSETENRFDIYVDPDANDDPADDLGPQVRRVPVPIDPLDNTIFSARLSGTTALSRPRLSALVSGSVRIGGYLQDEDTNDRIAETAGGPDPEDQILVPFPLEEPTTLRSLDYQRSTYGQRELRSFFVDPNIAASASYRLVDNLAFVDGALLAQERSFGGGNALADEGIGRSRNEVIYGAASISPYLARTFGHGGRAQLRFRATAVQVMDENFEDAAVSNLRAQDEAEGRDTDDRQFANDSLSTEILARYSSRDFLARLEFGGGASFRQVSEDGSTVPGVPEVEFDQASVFSDGSYRVSSQLSLTGELGYDEVTGENIRTGLSEPDISEISGVFWGVGVAYRPTQNTVLEAEIGERYGGTALTVNAQMKPTRRLTLRARSERTLDTGTQDATSSRLTIQTQSLNTIQQIAARQNLTARDVVREGLVGGSLSSIGQQNGTIGVSAFNRYSIGLDGDYGRTQLTASANLTENSFGGGDRTYADFQVGASRSLSRRANASVRYRYAINDGEVTTVNEDGALDSLDVSTGAHFVSLSGSYQVSRDVSVTGQVYRAESVDNSDDRVNGTTFEYVENAVTMGVRWRF